MADKFTTTCKENAIVCCGWFILVENTTGQPDHVTPRWKQYMMYHQVIQETIQKFPSEKTFQEYIQLV